MKVNAKKEGVTVWLIIIIALILGIICASQIHDSEGFIILLVGGGSTLFFWIAMALSRFPVFQNQPINFVIAVCVSVAFPIIQHNASKVTIRERTKREKASQRVRSDTAADVDIKRRQSLSNEELNALKVELIEAYNKITLGKSLPRNLPRGYELITLTTPENILSYWSMEIEVAKRDIFGVGGLEYISTDFIRRRCVLRLSTAAYSCAGVRLPEVMHDHFERLCQMEESDAREWIYRIQ